MKKKMLKKELGVTLVALIVTVIVLLILAGIVLSLVIGQGGIINIAQQAGQNHLKAQEQEKNELDKLYSSMMIATNDSSQITISMQDLKTLIQEEIKKSGSTTVPAGTVISYITGEDVPAGYLKCDGAVYNISEYQTLADSIKNGLGKYDYYGGDGTTTFAVPDLRGEFLRGTGTAARDTGTGENVGMHQDATEHLNIYVSTNKHIAYPYENMQFSKHDRYTKETTHTAQPSSGIDNWSSNNVTKYTSRPTNTSVLYCIKY